jgi:hypothetical protein
MSAWFDAYLGNIQDNGAPLEKRGALNFIGFSFTPLNDSSGKPVAWSIEIDGNIALGAGDYTGQLLQWSGTEWSGIMTLPDTGDTLVWNGSDWVPQPPSGGGGAVSHSLLTYSGGGGDTVDPDATNQQILGVGIPAVAEDEVVFVSAAIPINLSGDGSACVASVRVQVNGFTVFTATVSVSADISTSTDQVVAVLGAAVSGGDVDLSSPSNVTVDFTTDANATVITGLYTIRVDAYSGVT